jgi:site-specific recombinase XerD
MSSSQRTKINIKAIAAMQPNSVLWDQEVRGFVARRQFSEIITYSVVFRTQDQTQRWMKLGRHPILTPHLARQEAIRVLRDVTLGKDPAGERHAARNALTISELTDAYMEDIAILNGKKAHTIASDKSRIKKHIKPKLGKYRVISVAQEQIEDLMHSLSPGNGKRTIGLLGAIFTWALKRKIVTTNPVRGIDRPADVKRTRRLSDKEYVQLQTAINGASKSTIANVFLMLAITGWRSGEVKNLRWAELDLPRQIATLVDTKTGMSVRPLSKIAVQIIEAQPKNGPCVFEYHGKPIGNHQYQWRMLKMPKDVTTHSLRHSFASLAGDMGLADHTIARLLGHRQSSITSRYIHMEKSVIEASDLVATEVIRLMQKEGD